MKKIFSLISLFIFLGTYSQINDDNNLIKDIKKDATDFFINKKILKKAVVKNDLGYVLINEVNTNKGLGFAESGIYSIGVFQSHSEKHILLKGKSKYKILDILNIDLAIKEVIDFSKRNKFTDNEMLLYIKNIIQIYDDNYNHEYTTIENKPK